MPCLVNVWIGDVSKKNSPSVTLIHKNSVKSYLIIKLRQLDVVVYNR